MQFNPGQLYFLGREASDRLQQAAKLGLEGGDQAFDLTIKTVQFHVDAMTRLMTQTSHVKDFAGIKKLWSELFELMRESIATSNVGQKHTIEMALKATEMFYATVFEEQAKAEPVASVKKVPSSVNKAPRKVIKKRR